MDSIFSSLIIPAQTKLLEGGGVSRNHPVHPSVLMSCKSNFSLMNEPVLMKFYTVAVNNLRKCIKEDIPGQTYFKGDN